MNSPSYQKSTNALTHGGHDKMVHLRKETLMEVHGKLEQKEACCDNTDNETNEMFRRQRFFCQPDKLNLISGTYMKMEGEKEPLKVVL